MCLPISVQDNHKIYIMIDYVIHSALVQGMFSSLTFDYISKQKMGGSIPQLGNKQPWILNVYTTF